MAGPPCPTCGAARTGGARYCGQCGRAYPWTTTSVPVGGSYSPLRFQVDPQAPPPPRDPRYVLIVAGIALLVLGVMLLAVSAIVGSALSAGSSSCGGSGCAGAINPAPWFFWAGFPSVVTGIVFLIVGIAWALR